MWFLQTDTLLLMLGLSLGMGLLLRFSGKYRLQVLRLMPLLDLGLLWYVSEKLTLFYAAYTLGTWALLGTQRKLQRRKGFWFGLFCVLCTVPLCYSRFAEMFSLPAPELTLIGLAYNMLKAIDALYYEHFSGEKIPFERYVNYMLFFPVITAGPVFRYRDFDKAWDHPVPLDLERFNECLRRTIRGLFKKVVLVRLMTSLLERMLGAGQHWYLSCAIPLVSLLMLFLDMAGYADIAISMGGLMGVAVPENFKKPFQSPSFTVLYRNWHVTVSDWIRDHIFVLVSGKKLNKYQSAMIGMIVMLVMGLWHGFAWQNLVSGLFTGTIIALENIFELTTVNRRKSSKPYFVFRCVLVICLFSWDAALFTLTPEQITGVLRGYVSR